MPGTSPGADQWIRVGEAIAERRKLPAVSAFCRTHYGGVLTAAGAVARGRDRADRGDPAVGPRPAGRGARPARPIYESTTQLATLEAPPPEVQQLLGAIHGHQAAMQDFVSVVAGTMSPVEFFDPHRIERLLATA